MIAYPELGQKVNVEIEYVVSYSNGYRLTTDLDLKGRGIKLTGNGSDSITGRKTYRATELALGKLKKQYTTCYMASL